MEVNINRSLSSLTCPEPYVCDPNKAENIMVTRARWGRAALQDLAKSCAVVYRYLPACPNTVTVHYYT
jgi:hypothetical protein